MEAARRASQHRIRREVPVSSRSRTGCPSLITSFGSGTPAHSFSVAVVRTAADRLVGGLSGATTPTEMARRWIGVPEEVMAMCSLYGRDLSLPSGGSV